MQLPFFSKHKDNEKPYVGLFLKSQSAVAFLMKKKADGVSLEGVEKFEYTNGWNNLVEDVDEGIFKLEKKVNAQVSEVIFFLYSHFINKETQTVKKEYLSVIKSVAKNLDLKPLGFIECYEAVVNYLSKQEERLLNAVLIELDSHDVDIFIYQGGRLVSEKSIKRSGDLVQDLAFFFAEMKHKTMLPTRLILYNSIDLDEEATKIMSHQWTQDLFIQPPRVEVIDEAEILEGFVRVFGNQLVDTKKEPKLLEEVKDEIVAVPGFLIGQDVAQQKTKPLNEKSQQSFLQKITPMINTARNRIADATKSVGMPILTIVGLLIVLVSLLVDQYFFHKAKITIFVPNQVIKKSVDLTSNLTTESGDIAINIATRSASYTQSKDTTGTQEVGNKAQGSTTVFNFDDQSHSINKGTKFQTAGMYFVLQNDVTVASASETLQDGNFVKQAGKSPASLIASDIGSLGNIDKNQRFAIDTFSVATVFAVNDAPFIGGSKKTVRIVTKQDVDDLTALILKDAKSGFSNSPNGVEADEKSIPAITDVSLASIHPSKEIGQEATNLSVTADAQMTSYLFKNGQLIDHLLPLFNDQIPQGYILPKDKISYVIDSATKQKDVVNLSVTSTAKTIKYIDASKVQQDITFQNQNNLQKNLKNNFGILGFELINKDPLPFFMSLLPMFSKNITVVIGTL